MKAIFWKEWRENWKWAALAMLALGAAEFYGLLGESQTTSYMGENGLLRSAFLLATTFGHATVGFLLGLTQFRPEQNRDRWAVLLHRPAPRSALFLGKVLAGLALYLLAAAPALAASVLYAATPGHFAYPFLPGMVRPAAADLVAGFAFYGAAIFLVLERRWAARILGILAAALTIGVSLSEGSFRVALEATTAMSLVLLLAAWASMGGPANSRAGRIALFAVLFYGACGAGGLLLAIHSLLVSRDNYSGRELIVTEDGDPVWLKFSNGRQTIVDLQDQPLRDPRYTAFDRYNHLKTFERVCFLVGDSHGLSRTPSPEAYRGATCYATSLGRSFEEPWYYIPSQRLLRGYDGHSRRPTGVADQTGFHALGTAATPWRRRLFTNRGTLSTRSWPKAAVPFMSLTPTDTNSRTFPRRPLFMGSVLSRSESETPERKKRAWSSPARATSRSIPSPEPRPWSVFPMCAIAIIGAP